MDNFFPLYISTELESTIKETRVEVWKIQDVVNTFFEIMPIITSSLELFQQAVTSFTIPLYFVL